MATRVALILLLLLPAAGPAQDLDTAVSAVVRISGTRDGTPVRGTGFVVGLDHDKAAIVTASHVIEGVQQLEVTFAADATTSFPAGTVLGMEPGNQRGLALFQVRGVLPASITTLSFDTEVQLQRGEDLFLVGFPQMAKSPLTLRRTFAGLDGNVLQLDLPAGEGFSGAPVVRKGKALGVVTDEDLQLTFAVKALVAKDAVMGWGVKLDRQSRTPTTTQTGPAVRELLPDFNTCFPGAERTEDGIIFVRICPGIFTMGSAESDSRANPVEKPAHQVTLSEFWIGKTEITNEQYRRFLPNHQGMGSLPMTGVSWAEAKAACEHFGGRLPTEAEWEYAARAGSRTAWSFGDDEKRLGEYAWYEKNSGHTPHPVGTKKANPWGLHDMHGNVREWVADWYGSYSRVAQTDPSGPTTGETRVVRGGSIDFSSYGLRSAYRNGSELGENRFKDIGFRCVQQGREILSVTKDGAPNDLDKASKASDVCIIKAIIRPDDASVYLDGAFIGVGKEITRAGLAIADNGIHHIAVVRPGYSMIERTVTRGLCEGPRLQLIQVQSH